MKKQTGFTLVELAIVLMIIGLLIGGVLRGQELMNNSRVTKTVQQVNSYNGAYLTFMDKYTAMPGDMSLAMQRVTGCIAGNFCQNGDGNGIVGTPVSGWRGGQEPITTENTQFWKHLALAHLITGIDPSASEPAWGKSHPASVYPGGFTFITEPTMGLTLRLHGALSNNVEDKMIISSKVAMQIERKMDDGIPSSGYIRGSSVGTPEQWCEIAYDSRKETPDCVLYFILKR